MEFGSDEKSQGKSSRSSKHGVPEDVQPEVAMTENPKEQPDPSAPIQEVHNSRNHEAPVHKDTCREVNMEVSVATDEIVWARGSGATDAIRCILPVASDSSDFEDHLQKVQGFEDSEDKKAQGLSDSPDDNVEVGKIDGKDGSGAVNMEACVTSDDVIRAGGFGAKDDISNFLPVASDFTDFESHLRDARDYEDLKEEIPRHGLGWSGERK